MNLEEQVLQNRLAINTLIENSKKVNELDELPGGANSSDLVPIYRDSAGKTFYLNVSGLISANANVIFTPISLGNISTAGSSTTSAEIETRINEVGFSVAAGEVKIFECVIKINNEFYNVKYLLLNNSVGNYGDGQPTQITISNIYQIFKEKISVENEANVVIDLGNTGSLLPHEYINSNDSEPEWSLIDNVIYLFKCLRDGVNEVYLYTGTQGITIGQNNNLTTVNDFELLENNIWLFIEGSEVRKASGNSNKNLLENGDKVRFKEITNNGVPLLIVYATYNGGANKQLETSYNIETSLMV